MWSALAGGMKAKCLKDLLVYQRSLELGVAVTAILEAPAFRKDCKARDQLRDACDSVVANIAEGFPQPSDRAFARFLAISRASAAEVRSRLQLAVDRNYVQSADIRTCDDLAEQVARMTTALIQYLRHTDRHDRWLARDEND
jgi:four helix bundle protein